MKFRPGGDPVLYLSDPPGIDRAARRDMLDDLARLNALRSAKTGDPEIATRIAPVRDGLPHAGERAGPDRPSKEPASTFDLYGEDARKPGTFAANCLLARRLAERGVRFVQLFHRGWDQHTNLPKQIAGQCRRHRPAPPPRSSPT